MSATHLISVSDLGKEGIDDVMRLADSFVEVSEREIPRVPALRGRTVATVFFEDSTRTRLSFEAAAKRLSADTMTFAAGSSSLNKGESIRDTVETIEALGADAMIIRHKSAGVPLQVTRWVGSRVVNAGDGWHEHPTQALLDLYTVRQALLRRGDGESFAGLRVGIVGDVKHSRVARSGVLGFTAMGASVTLVAPPTLLPPSVEGWGVEVSHRLDDVLAGLDVVYLLRLQAERMTEALLPSLREYTANWGLTRARAAALSPAALVMHPGPMNRGVEIAAEIADLPCSVITRQVANGVAVRMAVLFMLLGQGRNDSGRPESGQEAPVDA
ncbi:MAG TPA: aspartate carbamoyltransferase catalytic subunit [Acidimicrobiales bacterium]|nr:aspartate carbamoyltransferase catalytic subunit [Acidimicrobiales bacterium]